MERRGRVVDREDDETVLHARLSVDARDGLAREELSHGVTAERHDDLGAEHGEMATQPHVAGDDFVRERIAVLGRSVANHVRDEDFPAVETDAGEELVEELPCRPHERLALHVLVVAGRLAEEEEARFARPVAGDRLTCAPVERARSARPDLGRDGAQISGHRVVHRC